MAPCFWAHFCSASPPVGTPLSLCPSVKIQGPENSWDPQECRSQATEWTTPLRNWQGTPWSPGEREHSISKTEQSLECKHSSH